MSLGNYQEVRPWARSIKAKVASRAMPPWHVDQTIGIQQFKDNPALSDREIETIVKWVDAGAPQGNPADLPAPRKFAEAGAWQIGTPGILSLAAASGALDVTLDAGIERIRDRSLALTGYLLFLADRQLTPYEFQVATPREPERRGGHVALTHPAAVQICKALKARGVVPDFRPPNVIRLAPVALYTTWEEIWRTVRHLRQIVASGEHRQLDATPQVVA